jgi:hypothetical protein
VPNVYVASAGGVSLVKGYIFTVLTDVEVNGVRVPSLWATVADSPEEARAIIQAKLPAGIAIASADPLPLAQATIKRLKLQLGEVMAL